MKRALLLAAQLAVSAVSVSPAQAGFEGTIVYKMVSGGRSIEMKVSSRGGLSRMELTQGGARGMGYQLLDRDQGTATFVMPEQKMYMVVDLAAQAEAAGAGTAGADSKFEITATGEKETLAGHECEHYLVVSDDAEMDVCAATGLGFMGSFATNPMARGAAAAPSIPLQYRRLAARFADGFQPLKVARIVGSAREPLLEVVSIAAESLPADLFTIPAGWRKFEMPKGMSNMLKSLPKRPPR